LPPIGRQFLCSQADAGNAIRNIRPDNHQILWRIGWLKVYEVFEHCQGKMLGSVCQSRSGTGPAAAEPVAAFSIQRGLGERPPENAVHPRHGRLTDSAVGDAAKDVLDGACAGLGVH